MNPQNNPSQHQYVHTIMPYGRGHQSGARVYRARQYIQACQTDQSTGIPPAEQRDGTTGQEQQECRRTPTQYSPVIPPPPGGTARGLRHVIRFPIRRRHMLVHESGPGREQCGGMVADDPARVTRGQGSHWNTPAPDCPGRKPHTPASGPNRAEVGKSAVSRGIEPMEIPGIPAVPRLPACRITHPQILAAHAYNSSNMQ